MKAKTTIRANQSGWVVYFDNDVTNFKAFRGDEPIRFIRYIIEKVAEIKIDAVVDARNAELAKERLQYVESEPTPTGTPEQPQ